MKLPTSILLTALLGSPAVRAADHDMMQHHASPYGGLERRDVKALSPEQLGDLNAGRGMQLALPAELNGYPGPRHVLDMADALELTPAQRTRTQALFDEMQAKAKALGGMLIERERALDALFVTRSATPASL